MTTRAEERSDKSTQEVGRNPGLQLVFHDPTDFFLAFDTSSSLLCLVTSLIGTKNGQYLFIR